MILVAETFSTPTPVINTYLRKANFTQKILAQVIYQG